ncbi:hypothetical protein NO2_1403 [Candidatus Termititenax persephonae]|uniref:Uncharacterized protein n=1 Tax=Candidatus Termititenax persephonae TaxID=2218525 RepID=A0A388TIY5_9BACT|nr:hypothetical protein NO2_1403 [Candidatus Termititenax persephonae]
MRGCLHGELRRRLQERLREYLLWQRVYRVLRRRLREWLPRHLREQRLCKRLLSKLQRRLRDNVR